MAFENMMGIVSIAPMLLRDMPLIMDLMQAVGYVFLSLFFGSIAIKGYRGYINTWVKFGARLGVGFFSLVIGLSIANFIPLISDNVFIVLLQRDLFNVMIGGFIASFLMLGAIYLVTHNIFDLERMKLYLNKFEDKVKKAEQIKRDEGKNTFAQKVMDPYRLAGIVFVVVLMVFTLFTFRGFPNTNENMLSALGLNQSDIDELLKSLGGEENLPPGCVSLFTLLQEHGDDVIGSGLTQTTDTNARDLVSAQGHEPITMYELVYNGDNYILAVTSDSHMCHIREGILCGCMDVSSFIKISQ